ncbi:MAG: tRNA lysidine(34) synthetase TilS [Hyphomicrobiales bacterium]|nr:tRNA lysidine(34) synthetase TilS [Hyphomicrobiales bacterium]
MLTAGDIDALFQPLAGARHLLIAVSGGPDSLALMALMARWRAGGGDGPKLSVAHVDHGLRSASASEGAMVAAAAAQFGLACMNLRWEGAKPATRLQERAREARYRLLVEAAGRVKADGLVTAHHAGDQAETVLQRLAHGSGIGGLAGMAPQRKHGDLVLWRPLLGLSKESLAEECRAAGLEAVDDPGNRNLAFERARLRHFAPERARLGLSDATLNRLARRAARAEAALSAATTSFLQTLDIKAGYSGAAEPWRDLPDEIRLRALGLVMARINDGAVVPLAKLESLATRLTAALAGRENLAATLAGCSVRIKAARAGRAATLSIQPAPPRRTLRVLT